MAVAGEDPLVLVAVVARRPVARASPPRSSTPAIPSSDTRRAVATEIESAPSDISAGTARVPLPGSRGANGPTPSPPSVLGLEAQVSDVEGERGREGRSTASPPTRPVTSTRGRIIDRVGGLTGAGQRPHLVGDLLQPPRSSTPETVASPPRRTAAASGNVRSQPRPSLILASIAIVPVSHDRTLRSSR